MTPHLYWCMIIPLTNMHRISCLLQTPAKVKNPWKKKFTSSPRHNSLGVPFLSTTLYRPGQPKAQSEGPKRFTVGHPFSPSNTGANLPPEQIWGSLSCPRTHWQMVLSIFLTTLEMATQVNHKTHLSSSSTPVCNLLWAQTTQKHSICMWVHVTKATHVLRYRALKKDIRDGDSDFGTYELYLWLLASWSKTQKIPDGPQASISCLEFWKKILVTVKNESNKPLEWTPYNSMTHMS